ncbi:MAG TPA: ATPase domain-containing protein [Candidatus Methylomirabilis sp.]|nr:ATPase domain-containing protein [Candidatus Methylomirabilis sp.]
MSNRVKFGIERLDAMLGGGLLPGTLTVVYGATGIGKTHLGLTFAFNGERCEGAPGAILDLTARGDSQQHREYAERLFGWELQPWNHTVRPGQSNPLPPPATVDRMRYCHEFDYGGRVEEYQVHKPEGREFRRDWLAAYAQRWRTVLAFFYFHFAAGVRRVVVDGVDPTQAAYASMQLYIFDELYRKIIHQDGEVLGMEILIPVWRHRDFIERHRYDHTEVTTLLVVTTRETLLDDLIARTVEEGDIGAAANTILLMGRQVSGGAVGRGLCVAKHRGSACSSDIAAYTITDRGLVFL